MKDEKLYGDIFNEKIAKLPDSGDEVESDFKEPDYGADLDATMASLDGTLKDDDPLAESKLVIADITVEEFKKRHEEKEKQKALDNLHRDGRNAFIEKWGFVKKDHDNDKNKQKVRESHGIVLI